MRYVWTMREKDSTARVAKIKLLKDMICYIYYMQFKITEVTAKNCDDYT